MFLFKKIIIKIIAQINSHVQVILRGIVKLLSESAFMRSGRDGPAFVQVLNSSFARHLATDELLVLVWLPRIVRVPKKCASDLWIRFSH